MAKKTRVDWVRPAHQARAQRTLTRFLDAAEALIADKGFADVRVAEIAARAGFSVGAFYARFRDKGALLHALQQRFDDEARATTQAALTPANWRNARIEEISSELILFLVGMHRERVGLLRELLGRAHGDAEIAEQSERLIADVSKRVSTLALERREAIHHPEPEAAVRFGLRLVLGLLKEAILFGSPAASGIPASDERLAEELNRAFLAYLGVEFA